MIFVTVGTYPKGFDRLVKAADEFASVFAERVIIQHGTSTYIPISAQSFQWASNKEMRELMQEARVVISHAGSGTIIEVFQIGKPLIVVPRFRKFGEHDTDHQYQLAHALAVQGRVIMLEEINNGSLKDAIEKAGNIQKSKAGSEELISALQSQMKKWAEE